MSIFGHDGIGICYGWLIMPGRRIILIRVWELVQAINVATMNICLRTRMYQDHRSFDRASKTFMIDLISENGHEII